MILFFWSRAVESELVSMGVLSDESTICKDEDPSATTYLVAHPYLCTKFYDCKPGVTYKREQDVYMAINGDHVFNPYTDDSDFRKNVNCSTEIGTFCYMYVTI